MVTEIKLTNEQINKALDAYNEMGPMILKESTEFHGQLDDLYKAVGMMVVGQFYGWRVMRLITSRSVWGKAVKLFGDPKTLMPERGYLWKKSLGLRAVDKLDDYWKVIQGHATVDPEIKRMAS